MKTKIIILILAMSALMALAVDDEMSARDALDRWHEFYHMELHKTDTNNPVLGLAYDGYSMSPNTRRSQLRYFDRKVCRQFAAMTNEADCSNFVSQVDEWTRKPLPEHP